MRNLFVFSLTAILISGCRTSSDLKNSSVSRTSASASQLLTRNGDVVNIPGLRKALNIPPCELEKGGDNSKYKTTDECMLPNEEELFNSIVQASFSFQSAQNPISVKLSQRDFHAKQHACLAGSWEPVQNLPRELSKGVFSLKKPVKIVVRYSNGSPKSPAGNGQTPPDSQPDARGLAIKLVGVPGESILNLEDSGKSVMNQDFVLINHPAFFLSSPKAYPEFLNRITNGKAFFDIMSPLELKVLKATTRSVSDVVSETFFSQTPYFLESKNVKYRVRLCKSEISNPAGESESKNPNFLRERIKNRIKNNDICLKFAVQVRSSEMPVEDAATTWLESKDATFKDVATIHIPSGQDIDDSYRDSFCENISFNPWNSLPENRPAGAINRARLGVYTGISRKRRLENKEPIREPVESEKFF